MKRINTYQSLNVFAFEKEVWDIGYHTHNSYEIILIESGKGKHKLNELCLDYKKGDVFLIAPNDAHGFEIEQKTMFIFIKYTEQFLLELLRTERNNSRKEALQLTLFKQPEIYENICVSRADAQHLFVLGRMSLSEFRKKNTFSFEVVSDLFMAMITILARGINKTSGKNPFIGEGERLQKILSYINIFALENEKMKIENLAARFSMSPNYISIYVKKHTGISIQNHILLFKLRTAEKLLKQSKYNINEIADRLDFYDASHFNRIFKKYKKISPLEFRTTGK